MSVEQFLKTLKNDGIVVEVQNEQLKITTTKKKPTTDQLQFLSSNKSEILKKISSLCSVKKIETAPMSEEIQGPFFYQEKRPSGEMLQITKDDFDDLIEFFRILSKIDRR